MRIDPGGERGGLRGRQKERAGGREEASPFGRRGAGVVVARGEGVVGIIIRGEINFFAPRSLRLASLYTAAIVPRPRRTRAARVKNLFSFR